MPELTPRSDYSPRQAYVFSLIFILIDFFVILFGLAWNGDSLNIHNISKCFIFNLISFNSTTIDFLVSMTYKL